MYKVFFKDRIVFFINEASFKMGDDETLYYKYRSLHSLRVVLTNFYHQEFIRELYLINDDLQKMLKDFRSVFKLVKAAGGLVKNEKSELLFIKRDGIFGRLAQTASGIGSACRDDLAGAVAGQRFRRGLKIRHETRRGGWSD